MIDIKTINVPEGARVFVPKTFSEIFPTGLDAFAARFVELDLRDVKRVLSYWHWALHSAADTDTSLVWEKSIDQAAFKDGSPVCVHDVKLNTLLPYLWRPIIYANCCSRDSIDKQACMAFRQTAEEIGGSIKSNPFSLCLGGTASGNMRDLYKSFETATPPEDAEGQVAIQIISSDFLYGNKDSKAINNGVFSAGPSITLITPTFDGRENLLAHIGYVHFHLAGASGTGHGLSKTQVHLKVGKNRAEDHPKGQVYVVGAANFYRHFREHVNLTLKLGLEDPHVHQGTNFFTSAAEGFQHLLAQFSAAGRSPESIYRTNKGSSLKNGYISHISL